MVLYRGAGNHTAQSHVHYPEIQLMFMGSVFTPSYTFGTVQTDAGVE
jgi:hypothetical protein